MELIGEIVDIIYKNEVNSYTIENLETVRFIFKIKRLLKYERSVS